MAGSGNSRGKVLRQECAWLFSLRETREATETRHSEQGVDGSKESGRRVARRLYFHHRIFPYLK